MSITVKKPKSLNTKIAKTEKQLSIANKYVGKGNQLLTLVPAKQKISRIKRHIRCFDKKNSEFVKEFELVRTNQKYLQSLFELAEGDQILYSYPVLEKQKPYIEKLSGAKLDLSEYDYFMEYNLLD